MRPQLDDEERLFRPPHCPNEKCLHHHRRFGWPVVRDGTHRRKTAPLLVQRFRCRACRRCFSSQSFRTTYWLKRPDLPAKVFRQLFACSGLRQAADASGCSNGTLLDHARRLGRHCLLFQQLKAPPAPPTEPLVLDGLRTFEFSQYWPCDINLVVGSESHFIHGFNLAELRRSGTMTPRQKDRRELLEELHGRPDPQATRKQVETLLRRVTREPCKLELLTDEHQAYVQALKRMKGWEVTHQRTSSKAPRSPKNPLWPANLLDLLVRHGGANHKRETIAWSKRAQGALSRLAVFQVMRNFVRGVRVRDGKASPSPAMKLGLLGRRLEVEDVLEKRLFPARVELPPDLQEVYEERIPTRQMQRLRSHELKYAF